MGVLILNTFKIVYQIYLSPSSNSEQCYLKFKSWGMYKTHTCKSMSSYSALWTENMASTVFGNKNIPFYTCVYSLVSNHIF